LTPEIVTTDLKQLEVGRLNGALLVDEQSLEDGQLEQI
jgi:hypothetical protein